MVEGSNCGDYDHIHDQDKQMRKNQAMKRNHGKFGFTNTSHTVKRKGIIDKQGLKKDIYVGILCANSNKKSMQMRMVDNVNERVLGEYKESLKVHPSQEEEEKHLQKAKKNQRKR